MKKLFLSGVLVLCAAGIFAQMPFPMGEPLKVGAGEMTINGMILSGFTVKAAYQEDNPEDGRWKAGVVNPSWAENRVDLYLGYKLFDYGALVVLRSQGYGENNFGAPDFAHAMAYANFLDNRVKVSLGKLHDWIYQFEDTRIWQTWLYGDTFRFTNDSSPSFRVEIKPVEGLNFGFQYCYVDPQKDFASDEAWKEFGVAGHYIQEKYRITAGVRLDSKADGMSRSDFRTYLGEYYGDANMLGISGLEFLYPKFKEMPGADYEDGIHAFAGTRLNAVKNLEMDFQIGLFGLGAFDKYGYGRANEALGYTIEAVPGLAAGISAEQQFYVNDVFPETMVNSPLLNFGAEVSYQLPFMKNVKAIFGGSMGFCDGVLDSMWEVTPRIEVNLNKIVPLCFVELRYVLNHKDFNDDFNIKPATNQAVWLSVMMLF